jgi:hypothetical protein
MQKSRNDCAESSSMINCLSRSLEILELTSNLHSQKTARGVLRQIRTLGEVFKTISARHTDVSLSLKSMILTLYELISYVISISAVKPAYQYENQARWNRKQATITARCSIGPSERCGIDSRLVHGRNKTG